MIFITKYYFKCFLPILFLSFIHNDIFAQQFNNWIFPSFNSITFNTNPISLINGGQITPITGYGASSISDKNGSLLFYSDGEKIYST